MSSSAAARRRPLANSLAPSESAPRPAGAAPARAGELARRALRENRYVRRDWLRERKAGPPQVKLRRRRHKLRAALCRVRREDLRAAHHEGISRLAHYYTTEPYTRRRGPLPGYGARARPTDEASAPTHNGSLSRAAIQRSRTNWTPGYRPSTPCGILLDESNPPTHCACAAPLRRIPCFSRQPMRGLGVRPALEHPTYVMTNERGQLETTGRHGRHRVVLSRRREETCAAARRVSCGAPIGES